MSIYDATFALIDALDEAKIPYMLSGSLSSMYYSFPRATTDADFVIDLGDTPIADLGETLGKGFHLDPQLTFEMLGGTTKHAVDVLGTPFNADFRNGLTTNIFFAFGAGFQVFFTAEC